MLIYIFVNLVLIAINLFFQFYVRLLWLLVFWIFSWVFNTITRFIMRRSKFFPVFLARIFILWLLEWLPLILRFYCLAQFCQDIWSRNYLDAFLHFICCWCSFLFFLNIYIWLLISLVNWVHFAGLEILAIWVIFCLKIIN